MVYGVLMQCNVPLVVLLLTLQCRPRCTIRTFNSTYAACLGALYGLENI
jgi:hypothetical protein